jgi:ABC-type sugar transport system ATPase subunit
MDYLPRTPEEMERIRALVDKAVGMDSTRGDAIEVSNISFGAPEDLDGQTLMRTMLEYAQRLGKPFLNGLLIFLFLIQRRGTAKVGALFVKLGLEGFANYLPAMVSGGMRQRCALARTLMFARDLVLLDEPLSSLDAITRRQLQAYLLLLQTEFKKSILMVTHDVEEALLLADDLLVLTAAPMRICERFRLDMPKPRDIADRSFLEIKSRVLARLEKEASW